MFQTRQLNDIYQLVEVSWTLSITPGAITTGSHAVSGANCFTGGPVSALASAQPANFNLGDQLEVIAPASIGAMTGLIIQAWPTGAANGNCTIAFFNASSGTITPASGQYIIVARRYTPELI